MGQKYMDPIDKALYDTVVGAIRAKSVNTNQVINIITYTMIVVEKYKQLQGREKLERVIRVLREVVKANDIGLSTDVANTLADMLEHEEVIVSIIENVIEATKNINTGKGGNLLSCFTCK